MKRLHFRIAWVMVAVAIAALDFWAIGAFLGTPGGTLDSEIGSYLLLGALPMANVLGIAILAGQRRRGSSPFLLGFVIAGALALTMYIALSFAPRQSWLPGYTEIWVAPIRQNIQPLGPFVFYPILCLAGVLALCLPQLFFALVGGYLFRRFRLMIISN